MLSPKNVIYIPKEALFNEINNLEIPNLDEYFKNHKEISITLEEDGETETKTECIEAAEQFLNNLLNLIEESKFYKMTEEAKMGEGIHNLSLLLDNPTTEEVYLVGYLGSIISMAMELKSNLRKNK